MTDKDKKLREDTAMLQKAHRHAQIREMLKMLGADPDKILEMDTDENIPILMQAKALVKKIAKSQMFEKEENGRYKIYAKITAITVMTASVGIMHDIGFLGKDPMPYYSGVSEWLGIPVTTLMDWWKAQDIIMREQISIGSAAVQRVTLKQLEIAERYTDGLHGISDAQIENLRKSPKGIAVMIKVATQGVYLAKLLNAQGEIIADIDAQKGATEGTGKGHGVTIMFPEPIEKPEKKKGKAADANDITDRG